MIDTKKILSDDKLAILLFHGVISKNEYQIRNYTRKHIEIDYFISILRDLYEWGTPLSIDEALEFIHTSRSFPARPFVVTFDDGFENNYREAAPVLSQMNIPATFYLTTDFIENNTMSWIDRIEYCFEKSVAKTLLLPWCEEVFQIKTRREKIRVLDEIRFYVKRHADLNVNHLVSSIFDQCGIEPVEQSGDPLDKKMNWDQVREIAADSNFTVGGHTHTHTVLTFLSPDKMRHEIATSLKLLDEKASVAPTHYSYPEGLAHCYSDDVIDQLKHFGVACCPTAISGLNSLSADPFHLKRITII